MRSYKGTNGAPKSRSIRPMSTERGMAYGGRPLWSRSPRSSPRTGKPSTWRRRTGVNDEQTQRGMQNATSRNCTERHTRTRRTRIAAGEHLSAAVQPETFTCGAYGRIYSNQGATTKGVTAETMDGMSLAKIDRIIEALRYERFRWTPVRRVNIPKPNGKTRAPGHTDGAGQAAARGHPDDSGRLLRAAVLRPLPWLSARPGLPHRLEQRGAYLDGSPLVRRGRHQGVLRQHRP